MQLCIIMVSKYLTNKGVQHTVFHFHSDHIRIWRCNSSRGVGRVLSLFSTTLFGQKQVLHESRDVDCKNDHDDDEDKDEDDHHYHNDSDGDCDGTIAVMVRMVGMVRMMKMISHEKVQDYI